MSEKIQESNYWYLSRGIKSPTELYLLICVDEDGHGHAVTGDCDMDIFTKKAMEWKKVNANNKHWKIESTIVNTIPIDLSWGRLL